MLRCRLILFFLLAIFLGPSAHASPQGDVNNDLQIDVADVILSLQLSAGMTPNTGIIDPGADANGDEKIGLAEAIYALHTLSVAKEITAFSLLGVNGVISGSNIAVVLPSGSNVSSLIAAFTVTGTSVKVGNTIQTSAITANDFTNPVIYTVIALDGSTTNYTVTVTVATSGPVIAGCPVFPAAAIFNTRIDNTSQFPIHASSSTWKSLIGTSRRLHLDWGTNEDQNFHEEYWGIPYNVVDNAVVSTTWPRVSFADGWPDESDCAVPDGSNGYIIQRDCSAAVDPHLPIPVDSKVKVEGGYCPPGGTCPDGDHHILVIEKQTCRLWEAYYAGTSAGQSTNNGPWDLLCSAAWDLNSLTQRPDGWTSGDAAGLPILPLLARVDEANNGEVKHAIRVTFRSSVMARTYVWPARHQAGQSGGSIPFGALLRLRADYAIPANWTTQAKALATAMQRYGLYVTDNGSDMYIQGEPSAQWQEATWGQLQSIALSEFDFVSLGSITSRPGFSAHSFASEW